MSLRQHLSRGGVLLSLLVILSGMSIPLASAAAPPSGTSAAASNGPLNLVVSPPSIGLTTKPGTPVSTEIKLRNQGLSTEHLVVNLLKFGANGQDGTPAIQDIVPSDEFGQWMKFSRTHFDADPNVWESITVTISPPKDAAFGYYYAVVFSRDSANIQKSTKANNFLASVASLILLDVQSPKAVRKVYIAEFRTAHKVQEFLPATFKVRLFNSGNTHVAARGNIDIFKGSKNLGIIEVNIHKGYILPQTYRLFTSQWMDGSPLYQQKVADSKVVLDKNNKEVTTLNWNNFSVGKLRFGKYTAKLVLVYNDGQGDVPINAQLDFWVIPWRILAVFLVLLIMFGTTLWILVIRPLKRRLRQGNKHNARRF